MTKKQVTAIEDNVRFAGVLLMCGMLLLACFFMALDLAK